MPLPIQFDWSEDEHMLYFVLHLRGIKAKAMQGNVALCDVYVKVNCHPALFEVDLLHEIDPEHPKTRCRVGSDKVTLSLKKKQPALWHEFRAQGTKPELRERRRQALEAADEREKERLQKRDDWKQDMAKAGESEQWRLDRENREQIEKWQEEEKEKWEREMYAAFDEETKELVEPAAHAPLADGDLGEAPAPALPQAGPPVPAAGTEQPCQADPEPAICEVTDEEAENIRAQRQQDSAAKEENRMAAKDTSTIWTDKDLDGMEEYVPDVRENPGKIGLRFTPRPRAGVPVRDRGQRAPPFPKQPVKGDAPPMLAGDEPADESDPVWLKDKADTLMVNGDYRGACNAYTEALKIAMNARAFANRAVAYLYLGNFEQCLEDCTHALRILDKRSKVPDGQMSSPLDPQDQVVRTRVEIRMGTAYLWLGAFNKAEAHYTKALEAEDGLDFEERKKVKEDLAQLQGARAAFAFKEKADGAADRAHGGGEREREALEAALRLYGQALAADPDSAVLYANRCFSHLRASRFRECLEDGEAALRLLKQWPTARRAPKKPARPSRLDPPFIDDPTFTHPDEQKQGEVDWLMKHGGGSWKDLPALPNEYEWVKDVAEKQENAWIAVRRKMPKATIDAIRRATSKLQDVLYSRDPRAIREHMLVAIEENKAGEGPSNKAIRQSEEYAEKLEEHEKEREAEREQEQTEARRELEEFDLEEALSAVRSGVAQTGFAPGHPAERTRRRLFVKVLLRRARAFEALGDTEASIAELRRVLRSEPTNPEASQRLVALEPPAAG